MEVHTNDETRIVSIWLTRAERGAPFLQREIKRLAEKNKARNYKTAVYLSGERDLTDQTQSLLLHNRRKQAQEPSR